MRRLIEAHTEAMYRSMYRWHLYSLIASRRGRRPVKGTNGNLHQEIGTKRG